MEVTKLIINLILFCLGFLLFFGFLLCFRLNQLNKARVTRVDFTVLDFTLLVVNYFL